MFRLCSWNIEWFTRLFDDVGAPLLNDPESLQRLEAIRDSLRHINPGLVGVVEAPDSTNARPDRTVHCLQNFAVWAGLPHTRVLFGYRSRYQQEIAVIYDPVRVSQAQVVPGGIPGDSDNPPFDETLTVDTDNDLVKEVFQFDRPPLEVDVRTADGHEFSLIVAHTKSKAITNATDMVHWERENRRNRHKLFGEATWIRRRVDERLGQGRHVAVMGDFNDGPGMDYYEQQFGRSAVEIVMGDLFAPTQLLRHHLGRPRWNRSDGEWVPASASFKDRFTEDWVRVLIDFILLSEGLPIVAGSHRVWNPYQDPTGTGPITDALRTASDHFPITIDLQ